MGSLVGGIFGKNKQPEAPSPAATAAAQTATNIGTAVANAYLTNPTQINSRGGYTSYTKTGEQQWNDPVTGQTYTIPTFTMHEVLSPVEAGTEYNNQDTKLKLSRVGNDQAQKVANLLSTNFNLDSAPAAADRAGTIGGFVNDPANAVTRTYGGQAQQTALANYLADPANQYARTYGGQAEQTAFQNAAADPANAAQRTYGGQAEQAALGGFAADPANAIRSAYGGVQQRNDLAGFLDQPGNQLNASYGDPGGYADQVAKVESALMQRMQPQLDRDRANLEQRLANQGLTVGTDAYNMAYDELNRSVNDARLGAILSAGQEQNRLASLDSARAGFENNAIAQGYGLRSDAAQTVAGLDQNRAAFNNAAVGQRYDQTANTAQLMSGLAQDRAGFRNAAAQQDFSNAQAAATTMADLSAQRQGFRNAAVQQGLNAAQQGATTMASLAQNRAAFGNQALQQQYGMNAAVADARASDRADYINEAQLLRNQPLNEISTLLGGSQIMPQQFVKANTPQMPTVDYAGLVNSNYAQQMQANSAQQAAQADVVKGLLGFAGGFI